MLKWLIFWHIGTVINHVMLDGVAHYHLHLALVMAPDKEVSSPHTRSQNTLEN